MQALNGKEQMAAESLPSLFSQKSNTMRTEAEGGNS